ncbi:MAG TPA: CvpA family protein [Planctomycetaceae bacterium]|nr:CvpA family protein [Planctomycetaceae bacterium]
MIDLILLAIVAGVAFMVSNDGAWNAGLTFLSVLFAGLIAMAFFEPVALLLTRAYSDWTDRWDMVALVGLFIGLVFAFRMGTERMVPTYIQVPGFIDTVGRYAFGVATGYVTMAFLLTALHTAPLPREFLGFKPERANLFNIAAPDRQWLGFTQYVSEKSLARYDLGIQVGALPTTPHSFDGRFEVVGDSVSPYPNTTWSSFPIRYATRRAFLYGTSAGTAAPMPAAPRPAPVPVAPAGGGNRSGGAPGF